MTKHVTDCTSSNTGTHIKRRGSGQGREVERKRKRFDENGREIFYSSKGRKSVATVNILSGIELSKQIKASSHDHFNKNELNLLLPGCIDLDAHNRFPVAADFAIAPAEIQSKKNRLQHIITLYFWMWARLS